MYRQNRRRKLAWSGSPYTRRLQVEQLEDRRMLAVFTVSNLDDAGAGSLREAITMANGNGVADTIDFSVTGAINLASQLPTITKGLTITGPGANLLTLDAGDGVDNSFATGDGYSIFDIDDGISGNEIVVTFSGLTITGGDEDEFDTGGGISNFENLTVIESNITKKSAGFGGGIGNSSSTLSVIDSTISDNHAGSFGGGIYKFAGRASITRSTLSENTAIKGGGLYNRGFAFITGTTISGNSATSQGGGIQNFFGGGTMVNSTLANNTAPESSGIHIFSGEQSATNTVIEGTVEGLSVFGSNNLVDGDFGLGPLADNGGPTQTHALLPGSLALDAGDSNIANPPQFDQRGAPFSRIADGNDPADVVIDIGAYEAQTPPSADFDTDGDVDGTDFWAWQRGYGSTNAVRTEGNSDDDTDVDTSDLAAWATTYSLNEATLLVATVAREPSQETPELLDAALTLEWLNTTTMEEEETPIVTATQAIETAFATHIATDQSVAVPEANDVSEFETAETSTAEAGEPWLADELLERVFG